MVNSITANQRSALARALRNPSLLPLLIQNISGLQWFDALENEGLLKPENNPKPVQTEEGYFRVPSWIIAEYLVNSSKFLRENENKAYAERYIKLIRNTTQYAIQHEFGNYRTWWQFTKILCNVPSNLVDKQDIELVEFWLNDRFETGLLLDELAIWILKLLEEASEHAKRLVTALFEIVYVFSYKPKKFGSKESFEAEFNCRSYDFNQFIEKTSFKAGQVIGIEVVTLLLERLKEILRRQNDDSTSTIWRPAIEEHSQNSNGEDANELVLKAFMDALMGFCEVSFKTAESFIKQLLINDYRVIKRVAVFVLGEHFDACEDETKSMLLNSDFFTYHYQHELWHLLAKNFNKFTPIQKQKTFDIIGQLYHTEEDSDERDERATAFRQINWLIAIKDYDARALALYKRALDITNDVPDHPDFSFYTTSGRVEHVSAITVLEMGSMPTNELVSALNTYEAPGFAIEGPDLEGLVKEFRFYVKLNPIKVVDELELFKRLNIEFVFELIDAYSEKWKQREEPQLNWDKIWQSLICFCSTLVSEEEFWNEENAKKPSAFAFVANRHWVVGAIGKLIESGCQSDNHAFHINFIDSAKDLLRKLLDRQEGEDFNEESDAVSKAINSPRGKCLQALINLALYSCRQAHKSGDAHESAWKRFEPIFERELVKAEQSEYEFATLAAQYLDNFLYLSKDWVIGNLHNLFYPNNRLSWLCAMQGYAYVNRFQPLIYEYLKEQELLIKALDEKNFKERVKDKFIQLIVISYLWDRESLEQANCLIKMVIERQQPQELRQLIWFIWSQRKYEANKDELTQKVFALWTLLIDKVNVDDLEGKKLASQLCHWAAFVTKLEEEPLIWLTKIAPFAQTDHNAYDLLQNLARLSKTYPFEAADVWQAMLESLHFDYPEESIKEIFMNLENQGKLGKCSANNIAAKYLEYGYQTPMNWLRDIREK